MLRPAIYIVIALIFLAVQQHMSLSRYFFVSQDAYVLVLFVAVWIAATYWTPQLSLPNVSPGGKLVVSVALVLCLALWAGTRWWMFDYPLTRDEHMVVFDAATYAQGNLAEPLPPEWAGYSKALVPAFLLETPDHMLMVSAYLPVNSAMRGFFGLIADPALMNPLQVAIGFVCLWWIARRVFPESAPAQWVALGCYLLSSQVLVTAMTPYAMTGHLTFNLVWLALFLKDRWWSHVLAMVAGVLAMGLHQFIFHPLFAGPFVLWLLLQRRWFLGSAYGVVYLAGVGLWMSWPGIVMDWAGVVPAAGKGGGIAVFLMERVLPLVSQIEPQTIQLMTYNLTRALSWNVLFALPLLLAAGASAKRREPIVLALVGGLVLTVLAMTILLPYQGHGWGYRYVHGLLGGLCLLAGFGYREFAEMDRRWADGAVAVMAAVTVLVALPANLWSARSFAQPHVRLTQIVQAQDADFVIIDDRLASYVIDAVRNRADLANRPVVLARRWMTDDQIAQLCSRGTVSVIGQEHFEQAGIRLLPSSNETPLPKEVCGQESPEAA